jgi:predicted RNA-binding protein with PIN domain
MGNRANSLLVDGYNLIHKFPDISCFLSADLQHARLLLCSRLSSYAVRANARITIVFDGKDVGVHPLPAQPNIKVLFSQHGEKADILIKRLAKWHLDDTNWAVVTSDLDIQDAARRFRLSVESSEDFAEKVRRALSPLIKKSADAAAKENGGKPEALKELDYWQKIFGG